MHIALLRAVNLGPHNKVSMAGLRELAAGLGLKNPQTVLQSGNVVFEAGRQTPATCWGPAAPRATGTRC